MSKMVNLHNYIFFGLVLHSPLRMPTRPIGTETILNKCTPINQVKGTSKIQSVPFDRSCKLLFLPSLYLDFILI